MRVSDSVRNPRLAEGRTNLESASFSSARGRDRVRQWTRAAGRVVAPSLRGELRLDRWRRLKSLRFERNARRTAPTTQPQWRRRLGLPVQQLPVGKDRRHVARLGVLRWRSCGGGSEPGGSSNDAGVALLGGRARRCSISAVRARAPFCRLPLPGVAAGRVVRERITRATSDQVRLPAEFKHISKRRKRN